MRGSRGRSYPCGRSFSASVDFPNPRCGELDKVPVGVSEVEAPTTARPRHFALDLDAAPRSLSRVEGDESISFRNGVETHHFFVESSGGGDVIDVEGRLEYTRDPRHCGPTHYRRSKNVALGRIELLDRPDLKGCIVRVRDSRTRCTQ